MPSSSFDCLGLRPVVHNGKSKYAKQTNGSKIDEIDIKSSSCCSNIILLGKTPIKDPSSEKMDDDNDDEVIIGRMQLLSSLLAACGCDNNDDDQPDETVQQQQQQQQPHKTWNGRSTSIRADIISPKRCQDCRDMFHWTSHALSRRMLRLQNKGTVLQVRGQHAIVSVNGTSICSSITPEKGDDNDDNNAGVDWSRPPINLRRGDMLQIRPRSGNGCIEFTVVPVQFVTLRNGHKSDETSHQSTHENADTVTAKENDSVPTKEKTLQSKKSENSATNRNPESKVDALPDKAKQTELTKEISAKVFFVPSGHDFYAHRRQILQEKLEELGAIFVKKIWDADLIVVSGSVRSLAIVAKHCKVLDSKLQKHLEHQKTVQCLLPSWADDCISSRQLLVPPGRKHVSPHFRSNASPPNKRDDDRKADTSNNKRQRLSSQSSRKSFPRNVKCAEVFKQLSNLHQDMPLLDMDQWKSYCFRIAAGRLLHLDFEVDSDPATLLRLRGIKGFGKSVVDKIEEILKTGTVSRIQEFQHHPERLAMKNLTDIWGVGRVKAKDLMALGYQDIHDVRSGLKSESGISKMQLDRNQLVGVDCYEDILSRMNRDEVEQIKEAVEKAVQRLFPGGEVTVQGSYRRGKRTCGDVDIHITHHSFHEEIPDQALGKIIDVLWNQGHIAYHLTVVNGMSRGMRVEDFERHSVFVPPSAWKSVKHRRHYTTEHNSFWMGCFYSPIHKTTRRRVDIKFYPYRERAFATVYFTGNGFLNRSMRLWAKRVFSWRLNDHGLFDLNNGLKRVMEASTEEEIFEKLKLVYKHPHERDSFDALEPKSEILEENGVLDGDVVMQMQLSEKEFQQEESSFVWVD
ncbi:DNA polymerase beta palm domain containing protein [Nitzschia inconspicua]|uniref:DNA polymerase beta palm domain containing protein n=1 Tax=Nitzschia inconspicua TaxID=303405 RepID=A0A9K3PJJ5_9STRA|nr:DNA polymerase beta palm domain containing protein [Nitzschia inconspicua]